MDWSKLGPILNEIIKSQGMTLVVVLLLAGYLLNDKNYQDKITRAEVTHLKEQIHELQEWRIEYLKNDRQKLIKTVEENNELLSEISKKLDN